MRISKKDVINMKELATIYNNRRARRLPTFIKRVGRWNCSLSGSSKT